MSGNKTYGLFGKIEKVCHTKSICKNIKIEKIKGHYNKELKIPDFQRELDEMNRKYRQEKEKTVEASPKSALNSNGPVAFSPKHVPQQQHPAVPQSFSITSQNARRIFI